MHTVHLIELLFAEAASIVWRALFRPNIIYAIMASILRLLVQQHLDAKPHLLLFGWLNGIGCTALTKCKAPTQDAHKSYNTPSMESDRQAGKSPVPGFGGSLISVTRGMDAHKGSSWRILCDCDGLMCFIAVPSSIILLHWRCRYCWTTLVVNQSKRRLF